LRPCPLRLPRAILSPPPPLPEPSRRTVRHFCHRGKHHRCAPPHPPSPPRPPIKGPPQAPCSATPGLSHSTSLPWTQSSSAPSSVPSLVSSALLSLVAYGQIALALKLHLSVASLAHTSASHIAPGSLAGDFTAASARHRAVDRPPQAPSGQIGPSTMIPYPRPCLAPTPPSQNRNPGGEPPRGFTGGRASAGPPPPRLRSMSSAPPSSGMWAHTHGAVSMPSLRRFPLAGLVGRLPALGWAKIPPGQAS
jgi:hypothetical protein